MLRKDLRLDICPDVNPPGTTNPVPCGSTPESQFWFIHDITDKATGSVLIVLLILYVGSQLVSSLLMMTATADQNQKIIMLVLPFLFVGFIFRFPAGLILYWITTNIWTIGQQQFLRRVIGSRQPEAPPLPEVGPVPKGSVAASGGGGGGGGLLARLSSATHHSSTDGSSAGNGAASDKESRVTKAPPPPPRSRKRKRSGRRR
jgi:YidC/Oxa1 family membrane protein insertase